MPPKRKRQGASSGNGSEEEETRNGVNNSKRKTRSSTRGDKDSSGKRDGKGKAKSPLHAAAKDDSKDDSNTTATAAAAPTAMKYPATPDGHYFVVRNRLWRCTNPNLPAARRAELQRDLMSARRALTARSRSRSTEDDIADARSRVQEVKEALGERGPAWWNDADAPLVDRKMVWNTDYKAWWDELNARRGET